MHKMMTLWCRPRIMLEPRRVLLRIARQYRTGSEQHLRVILEFDVDFANLYAE